MSDRLQQQVGRELLHHVLSVELVSVHLQVLLDLLKLALLADDVFFCASRCLFPRCSVTRLLLCFLHGMRVLLVFLVIV